jgi:spermidine synthase
LKERPGHLPLLLHPDPKRVLYLGSATGHTAGAAVAHDVEEIVLVEIVPEVQTLAGVYFAETNRGVHHDPRTRLIAEDGRNHLRATRDRYDVVVSDLFTPWRPGVGSLYAREHFASVRSHLTDAGVFCQWLPIFQLGPREFDTVAATFLDVVPDATLWRGDFYLLTPRVALCGFAGALPTESEVEARRQELAAAGVEDRWLTGPLAPWMLYVGPLAARGEALEGVARNTDDRPRFEFLAARTDETARLGFRRLGFPRLADRVAAAAAAGSDLFGPEAARGAAAGIALARLNAAFVRQRPATERAEAEARVAETVPAELLAAPDPSAAELWMWKGGGRAFGTDRAR